MVLISKKNRRIILEHLFKEGVICVKKDPKLPRHNEIEEVPNLHVMMVMKSMASRDYVDEKFNWQWHYYFLKNEGIEYLREVLHLPPQVFPSTLTKQRPSRPQMSGGESSGGGGKGKGGKGGGSKGGKGGGAAAGRSVFLTGFDFDTDESAVQAHFGKMGAIESLYFQSKWSAVVTYVDASAAQKAVSKLDGSTMSGQSRYVAVRLDDPDRSGGKGKGSRKGGSGGGKGGSGGGGSDDGRSIYVSGFDYDTNEDALNKHFGYVGGIESLYFQSKGGAVITYTKASAAQRALTELAGTTMSGQSRYVAVKLDTAAHRQGSQKSWGKGGGKGKWRSRE